MNSSAQRSRSFGVAHCATSSGSYVSYSVERWRCQVVVQCSCVRQLPTAHLSQNAAGDRIFPVFSRIPAARASVINQCWFRQNMKGEWEVRVLAFVLRIASANVVAACTLLRKAKIMRIGFTGSRHGMNNCQLLTLKRSRPFCRENRGIVEMCCVVHRVSWGNESNDRVTRSWQQSL